MTNTAQNTIASGLMETIELIGGPICGQKVNWPSGEKRAKIKYAYGFAIYEQEKDDKGDVVAGKALYVEG